MKTLLSKLSDSILSVPVRIKIFGIIILPVLILAFSAPADFCKTTLVKILQPIVN